MGKLLEELALCEREVEACREDYGEEDEKTLSAMRKLAGCYADLEKYADALKVRKDILVIVSRKYDSDHKTVLEARSDVAHILRCLDRRDEALAIMRENLNILQRKLSMYMEDVGKLDEKSLEEAYGIVDDIGMAFLAMPNEEFDENYEREMELRRNVVAAYKKVLGTEHEKTLDALTDFGESLSIAPTDGNMMNEMLSVWKEAIKIGENLWGEEDERTLKLIDRLAMWAEYGDHEEAARIANEKLLSLEKNAAEENKSYYGEADKKTIDAWRKVISRLEKMERKDEAISVGRELLDVCCNKRGDTDDVTLDLMNDLAFSLHEEESYDEELKLRRQILANHQMVKNCDKAKIVSAMRDVANTLECLERLDEVIKTKKYILQYVLANCDERDILDSKMDLAMTLHDAGQYAEELPLRREIFETFREKMGEGYPETITAMTNLAGVLHFLDDNGEALSLWQDIVSVHTANLGATKTETLTARFAVAYMLLASGKHKEALAYQKETMDMLRSNMEGKPSDMRITAVCLEAICFMAVGIAEIDDKPLLDEIIGLVDWWGMSDPWMHDRIMYVASPATIAATMEKLADKLDAAGKKKSGESYKSRATELKGGIICAP